MSIQQDITEISVLRIPGSRANKLIKYLDAFGEPKFFEGLEVAVDEYGDLFLSWDRRGFLIEVAIPSVGPLLIYEEMKDNKISEYSVVTVRSAAAAIHKVWRLYKTRQRALRGV